MSMKRFIQTGLMLCFVVILIFQCGSIPAYAHEKSYYEITENTCDEMYNIILLGGGGDNQVFRNGESFGRVTKDNILKAIDENKINVLAGHSTGANQVELFIRDGSLNDVIDVYVFLDAQAYVEDVRYCTGDTYRPILIFISDQMNRINWYTFKQQYSNYEIYHMKGTQHVNLATEHFFDVLDVIHNYFQRPTIYAEGTTEEISREELLTQTVDLTVKGTWNDADNRDGKRPDTATVSLYDGDTLISEQTVPVSLGDSWTCSFGTLPKYRNGVEVDYYYEQKNLPKYRLVTEIDYRVEVQAGSAYTTTVTREGDVLSVECVHTPEIAELKGTIDWLDRNNVDKTRPQSVKLSLMNGSAVVSTQTVTAANGWKWEFTGLPKYADGKEITYTLKEDAVSGYSTEISGRSITNTRVRVG